MTRHISPGGNAHDSDPLWWRHAVIYQIYPKSFSDSNGDGIGDLRGIIAKLRYVADLGVDAIWISPFFESPQRDGGYDVSNFRDVDPIFGTLGDARELIEAAHRAGLRVIIDIVPNHTSDQHRFFLQATATSPGSHEWGRYHALPGTGLGGWQPPNDWRSVFGGSAWDPILSPDGKATGWWYLHLFDSTQPDLNWEHPDVQWEFADTLRFWFEAGVDGFRIDVAMALVKAAGYPPSGELFGRRAAITGGTDALPQWNQPGVHDIWRAWRAIADSYDPPRVFVGEIHAVDAARLAPYLRPDELHMGFNFNFLRAPWDATLLREVISDSIAESEVVGAPASWVIENHDFNRSRTRFGRADTAGSSGLKPLPIIDDARGLNRARAALLLMLSLPGAVYIYQGQELGLPEVEDIPPELRQDPAFARTAGTEGYRDGCRVPLPWSQSGSSLGFGPEGSQPWLPQPPGWGQISVAAQDIDPQSTLNVTRTAARLRRAHCNLSGGQLDWLPAPENVLLAARTAPGSPAICVATNLGHQPVKLPVGEVLLASATNQADPAVLDPDCTTWFYPSPGHLPIPN